MKYTTIFTLLILFTSSLYSQSTTYDIKGIIEDTLQNPLIHSTVLLLEKSDSTMVEFTRSEIDGSFKFKDVSLGDYVVKSTYIGYIPLTVDATSVDGKDVNLGTLKMTEIATELMEVVIKAAKAPMKMRGDTLEYDATTFKVPDGSTVEDLLRRLPGMEVDQDGSITADGKDVTRVTVDGKSFFGNSPQAATKNLPAEGVSKVQVFDTKTEEDEITGASTSGQDKTMNLELKEEFKSGGFGRIVAGVGTEGRAELKGNYNKFNKKIQFSLVGVGNNTGRNGLSWNDYQDFLGSQSFNFSDGTDYGFGSRGHTVYFGGGDSGLESSIQSIFFQGRNNGGLPENYNGGVNFNYDDDKLKVNSVYYYNQAGLDKDSRSNEDHFFQDFVQNENRTNENDNISRGHRVEMNIEKELDSLHTIKIEMNGAKINNDRLNLGSIDIFRDDVLTSIGTINNNTNTTGYLGNGLLLFRKKFQKKGRSMGINTSFLTTELENDWTQASQTDFYKDATSIESTQLIDQQNSSIADKNEWKVNALYVEPLAKYFFLNTFYNYSDISETGDRDVKDITDEVETPNEFLSRTYDNTSQRNRIGSYVRYSKDGTNISVGAAYQNLDINGIYTFKNSNTIIDPLDRTFTDIVPFVSLTLTPVRNSYIDISYTKQVGAPSINDLQPAIDNTNPFYIREGNPNLVPENKHAFRGYISRSYPASGIRASVSFNYGVYQDKYSIEESINDKLVTTIRPINVGGGSDGNMWSSFTFPIIKNKITSTISLNLRYDKSPSIINELETLTTSKGYTPGFKFNITPNDDLAIYINGRYGVSNTTYDIAENQDRQTKSTNLGIEFNTKLPIGFFLNSSFNYQKYSNDRFNVDQEIPILNASIYRQFLPNNTLEVRLSVYDGLSRNQSFSQYASGNSISQSFTDALERYFMLSMTYNIKGLKDGVRKKSWW